MQFTVCPTHATLEGWAMGELGDDVADAVEEHLDTCPTCEGILSRIESSGLFRVLKSDTEKPVYVQETQCLALIQTLQQQRNPATLDRLLGQSIRDYEIIERLGQGGMGTVYRARHTRLNKYVALKLLTEKLSQDAVAIARFQREMQAVGLLDHPNIVRAMDAGEVDGNFFLVMEFIDGFDLDQLTANNRSLPIADACELARQAAEALRYAHSQGLVHRDVKPSNLMLQREPDASVTVKLLDLGLAMIQDDTVMQLTGDGHLVGTLKYMAPEQADETNAVDSRADIYALGATLYRLLTGNVPFSGPEYNSPAKRIKALTSLDAPSVATKRSGLPDDLVEVLDRMLYRKAADRPADLSEVIPILETHAQGHRLDELYDQTKILLKEFGAKSLQPVQLKRKVRRSRNRLLVSVVVLPLVLLVAVFVWYKSDEGAVRNETPAAPSVATVTPHEPPAPSVARGTPNEPHFITVSTTQDDAEGSLRAAIAGAKDGDVIRFDPGLSGATIELTSGPIEVKDKKLTLDGSDLKQRVTLDAKRRSRVLQTRGRSELTMDSFIITGGRSTKGGAGIDCSSDSKVEIVRCLIHANDAMTTGRSSKGGGILNEGLLHLSNCVLRHNGATEGGAVANMSTGNAIIQDCQITQNTTSHYGAGLFSEGNMTVIDCEIAENESLTRGGTGIEFDPLITQLKTLLVERCLIRDNIAAQHGSLRTKGKTRLVNCVLARNRCRDGPVIYAMGNAELMLIHCSIFDNVGGGIRLTDASKSKVFIESTIFANNHGGIDVSVSQNGENERFVARGVNLIGTTDPWLELPTQTLRDVSKVQSPLGIDGESFHVVPPLIDSPVIDAATITEFTPQTDIRGVQRPQDGNDDGNAAPDLGAIEYLLTDDPHAPEHKQLE